MSFASELGRSRRRDLAIIATAKAVTLFGDELAAVTLALRLQGAGHGPRAVAALLLAGMLPLLVCAPLAGRLVDRLDNRRLLLVSSLGQLGVCAALAFTTSPAVMLALVAVLGAGQAVNGACWQALVPRVAAPDHLARAMGQIQAATTVAGIAAPAVAGLLTGWFGTRVPLLVDAATFLAVTTVALVLRAAGPDGATTAPSPDGVPATGGNRLLRLLLFMVGLFVLLGAMVNVVEVFLVRHTLHAGSAWYGALGACFGVGLLAGSLLGGRVRGQLALARMFVFAAAGLAASLAAMSVVPDVAAAVPVTMAVGVSNGMLNVALGTLVMGGAPSGARGRVGATLNAVAAAAQLGAYALGGLLSLTLTPREIFAVAGITGLVPPLLCGRQLVRAAIAAATATTVEPAAVRATV